MDTNDIDKILEDIKKRKERSQSKPAPVDIKKPAEGEKTAEKKEERPARPAPKKDAAPKESPKKPKEEHGLSAEGKRAISKFINRGDAPADADNINGLGYASKRSEDYIDENFKNFFTQSVIVTKPPERTNVEIKRKKGGFFRKKYITDSLTLKVDNLDDEPAQAPAKRRVVQSASKSQTPAKGEAVKQPAAKPQNTAQKPQTTSKPGTASKSQTAPKPRQTAKPANNQSLAATIKSAQDADSIARRILRKKRGQPAPAQKTVTAEKPAAMQKSPVSKAENPAQTPKAKPVSPAPEKGKDIIKGASALADFLGEEKATAERAKPASPAVFEDAQTAVPAVKEEKSPASGDTQTAVPVIKEAKPAPDTEANTIEIVKGEKPEISAADEMVNAIYTSVIENQAKTAVIEDTAFISLEKGAADSAPAREEVSVSEKTKELQSILMPDEEEEGEPVFEEYVTAGEFFDKSDEDSEDILGELKDFRSTLNLRIIIGMVTGVILTYFTLASQSAFPMPRFISPQAQPLMFYITCRVVFSISLIGFLPTILSGFTASKKAPAPDTFVSLAAIMSLAQLIFAIAGRNTPNINDITLFAPFVCFALGANAMGKRINTDTIIKNLSLANVPDGINAGYIIDDDDAVKRLARTLDEKVPKILVSRKTGAIKNFIHAGFSIHSTDYAARKVALVSYGVTAVCLILGFLKSNSLLMAICCGTGAAAFMSPLSRTLVNSVPGALMQKNLRKVGALVNGWLGIDQLSKTTHVNFDAKHLFPAGTVTLHGIKTFEKERVDLAILYAASVLIKECDTMRPVFMDVIEGKTDILPRVESCEYFECQGYVAWVEKSRVIIGNRTLMKKYDIDMPPESLEARYTQGGRKPVYLAVGGRLFGMFVFSYKADRIVKDNLDKLVERGVSVILSSKDFNIDSALIEDIYGISGEFVTVMNQNEAALLEQFTKYAPETEACVAHLDSLTSLVSAFCSAESCKSAEKLCNLIQTLSVILGGVLSVMFTYSQTLPYLSIVSMLLIGFAWMAISTISAFARKY